MSKVNPRILDLYCGAGGAGRGYNRAGFDVIGIDLNPQPNYPFAFDQADALLVLGQEKEWIRKGFDAIHASPPCQAHSKMKSRWADREHVDLIAATRELLIEVGLPYVIENVPGAPLHSPITLCGSMFNLGVRRHRLFESSFPLEQPACSHVAQGPVIGVYGHPGGRSARDGAQGRGSTDDWRIAMGIPWMTGKELAQAIPPAYTEFIARQLLPHL